MGLAPALPAQQERVDTALMWTQQPMDFGNSNLVLT